MTAGMSSTEGPIPQTIMSAIFMATGLVLRQQYIIREIKGL